MYKRRSRSRWKVSRRGMSLIEVMVVIAIILTLMGVIAFGVISSFQSSQVQTTIITMGQVSQSIEIYMLRKKRPPETVQELEDMFANEGGIPQDSWGSDFAYLSPGPGALAYELVSLGADKQEGGTGNDEDIKWSEVK